MSKLEEQELSLDVDSDLETIGVNLAKLDLNSILEGKELYESLVHSFPVTLGKAVSKKEREELNLKDSNLVYGEITYEAFATVIEKIKKIYGKPDVGASGYSGFLQKSGGIFYDLGSGTGKPVIAAAVAHNFDVCYGIEILEGLFSVSLDIVNTYNTRGKAKLAHRDIETHCQLIKGSVLKLSVKDWRDADVVFVNSTCFDEALMMGIANIANGMKKGSFFISLTKRLPSPDFVVLEYEMYKMSWGEATIFIMQKVTDPRNDYDFDEEEGDP